MTWLRSNEYLSNEPTRYQPQYVLYMEKDDGKKMDINNSESSNSDNKERFPALEYSVWYAMLPDKILNKN